MVTRSALQNAASIAKNILADRAMLADPREGWSGHGGGSRRHGRHGWNDVRQAAGGSEPVSSPEAGQRAGLLQCLHEDFSARVFCVLKAEPTPARLRRRGWFVGANAPRGR
jgi:hypothetical protein